MGLRTEYAIRFWRELKWGGYWTELDTHGDGQVLTFDSIAEAQGTIAKVQMYGPSTDRQHHVVKRQISDWEVV